MNPTLLLVLGGLVVAGLFVFSKKTTPGEGETGAGEGEGQTGSSGPPGSGESGGNKGYTVLSLAQRTQLKLARQHLCAGAGALSDPDKKTLIEIVLKPKWLELEPPADLTPTEALTRIQSITGGVTEQLCGETANPLQREALNQIMMDAWREGALT